MKSEFSLQISENTPILNLMKILAVRSELSHDGANIINNKLDATITVY